MADRILITGGAGFIGCALGAQLVADGHEVVAFDNLHPQVHAGSGLPPRLSSSVRFVPGDVTVASNWMALFKYFQPEVIVHLAAETGTGQSLTESSRHASVNVSGTAQLIDALTASRHIPRQIILASSRAVYGDGAWKDQDGTLFYPMGRARRDLEQKRWDYFGKSGHVAVPVPQDARTTRPNPISVYAATKLAQEHILGAWCRAFGSCLTVLRLQNVYGLGQAPQNAYTGILTLFVRLAQEHRVLDIYEDGAIVRDFVHVSDVARAMCRALETKQEGTYDIGSGEPTTIAAVARKVAALFGAPEPVVSGRFRDGDVRAASCSIEHARQSLGWEPRVSVVQGLSTFLTNQP